MQKKYKYHLNKNSKRITIIVAFVGVAIIVFFSLNSISGYLPAWGSLLLLSLLALYVLSIPRFVKIDDDFLEIHCLVELTKISITDIKSIERMDKRDMRFCIPLLGSYGFFGYYGYYYNISEMNMVKIYASQWDNFLRIEDIYEDVFIINCDDPNGFIDFIENARRQPQQEIAE